MSEQEILDYLLDEKKVDKVKLKQIYNTALASREEMTQFIILIARAKDIRNVD